MLVDRVHPRALLLVGLLCGSMALACALPANLTGGAPSKAADGLIAGRAAVMFLAPDSNSTLAEGATIQIAVSAQDAKGVSRVDLTVDNIPLGSQTAALPIAQQFTALQVWTVSGVQGHLLNAIAYAADNSVIGEASMTVSVVALPSTPTLTALPPTATLAPFVVGSAPPVTIIVPTASITMAPILSPPPSLTNGAPPVGAGGTIGTSTAAPASAQGTVTNPYLNVRSGPGITYAVIGSLKAGDVVSIIGRNADRTWWIVQGANVRGWIINTPTYLKTTGDLAKIPLASAPPSPVPTASPAPNAGLGLAPTSTP